MVAFAQLGPLKGEIIFAPLSKISRCSYSLGPNQIVHKMAITLWYLSCRKGFYRVLLEASDPEIFAVKVEVDFYFEMEEVL